MMLRIRWLCLRLLGALMVLAFASLWYQIQGLSGPTGVIPAEQYLEGLRAGLTEGGSFMWWRAPTLGWLNAGETALDVMCAVGAVASGLLLFNLLPQISLMIAWVLYASLINLSGVFMSYQWDVLLAEVAILSLLWAPAGLRPGLGGPIPKITPWIFRVLLFKLVFSSGLVKLVNLDEAWLGLSAAQLHYWTQPLPHRVAWYAHQLPTWFHQASVAVTLIIELVVPLLIFTPRKIRVWAFFPLAGLQIIFAATGNYGFFNLLVFVLCLTVLDDDALARVVPSKLRGKWFAPPPEPEGPPGKLTQGMTYAALAISALFALAYVPHAVVKILEASRVEMPAVVTQVDEYVRPWRVASGPYGLFARVVPERMEIEIQGSADGRVWKTYPFKYKPGDVDTPPAFTAFHMPRLDWHMWTPGLGANCAADEKAARTPWWFEGLMRGLVTNDTHVVGLLASNPFAGAPPKMIRARLWRYTFSDPEAGGGAKVEKGKWWTRVEAGAWCGPRTRADLVRGADVAREIPSGRPGARDPSQGAPALSEGISRAR